MHHAAPSPSMPEPEAAPATYRQLFALREYRALFAADVASLLGDQIAAVAVSVLLYQRSGSALLAALGYATLYLPWFIGGPVLAAWAERRRPRAVLLGCDLSRAALIGLAALPGLPLAAVAALVLVAAFLAPPFDSVGQAVMVDALPGDTYPVGVSVRSVVHQVAQLVGFATGGALIGLIGAHPALALNAGSFLISAAFLRWGIAERAPLAASEEGPRESVLRDTLAGFRLVGADPALRVPLLVAAVLAACVVVPEAIAPAYADGFGGGPTQVGLIMAATAAGTALGSAVLGRWVAPAMRLRLLAPMSVLSCLPLVLAVVGPGLVVSLVLFFLAGAVSSVTLVANTLYARAVAPAARARAFAVAMAALYGAQTLAIVVGGLAATLASPHLVVAAAGVTGVGLCLLLARDVRALQAAAA